MGSSLPFKLASGFSSVDNNDNGYKVMMMDNFFLAIYDDWYSKYALRLRSLCDYLNQLLWKEVAIEQIIAISYFESIPVP
jgi:hypothetical protein